MFAKDEIRVCADPDRYGAGMGKRKIAWLIYMLIGICMLSGCAALPEKEEQELPQLRIGITNYAPYSYKDINGTYAGIDVELAREACARMGYEPVFREVNVASWDASLKWGEIDCLWTCLAMTEREDYQWAGPYLYTRRVVAVAADSMIQDLSDLNGRTIGVQAGSTSEKLLSDPEHELYLLNPKRINAYSDIGTVFTALRKGYVDAIVGHEGSLNFYISEYPGKFRYLDISLSRASLGVAFSNDADPQLIHTLTKILNEMTKDGTTAEILTAHGMDVETNLYEVK